MSNSNDKFPDYEIDIDNHHMWEDMDQELNHQQLSSSGAAKLNPGGIIY